MELRGALPLAINVHDINWPLALLVAYIGNLLPVPFLLLLFDPVARFLSKIRVFGIIIEWVLERARRRKGIVEKYGPLGLVLFVAIPLPVTGAWTGSLIAFILGIKFKYAFPAIALGVLIAGVIVTTLCVLFDMTKIPLWIGAVAAAVVLTVTTIVWLVSAQQQKRA